MGSRGRLPRSCRVEVDVSAPAEAVWRVVSDVTRTGEWSHECVEVGWLDGARGAAPGVRFRGANRSWRWRWSRVNVMTEVEPGRSLAWRTVATWRFPDSTAWRITLEPAAAGTRIVQSYDVVQCPRWWEWLVTRLVQAHQDRSAALTADLVRLGAVSGAAALPG